ncbi:MAG: hypothetical protein FJY25_16710 [Betaproteobacteria bacterium]|nr:hypothetical protein [Betaproteobacteria bacterium]
MLALDRFRRVDRAAHVRGLAARRSPHQAAAPARRGALLRSRGHRRLGDGALPLPCPWRGAHPEAFHWYNHRHHHASIAHFTPAEVHTGRHLALREVRQRVLDRAWDLHPERFVRGRPVAEAVPGEVWINRAEQEPASNVPQAAAS